jgi:uncharacterized membrane protein
MPSHCPIHCLSHVLIVHHTLSGYVIVCDNWYTSIALVLALLALGYMFIGTLRANRKGVELQLPKTAKVTRTLISYCISTANTLIHCLIIHCTFTVYSPSIRSVATLS